MSGDVLNGVVLGEEVRFGTGALVYAARRTRDGAALLATCTGPHGGGATAEAFADVAGIAPLAGCGLVSGHRFTDVLLEELPAGATSAMARAPLPVAAIAPLVRALARVVAGVHATGTWIGGIVPELIFVDTAGAFAVLAPRGPGFIGGASKLSGPPTYLPYVGYEEIALGKPGRMPGEVFAVCGSIYAIATGHHPFGDDVGEMIPRVMANDVGTAWPADLAPPLRALLARGLDPDPAKRPTAAELAAAA